MNSKSVIYARVSSKDQEKEGFSIPAQIKLLQEYAEKNDLEIVKIFQETESAKIAGRKGFNEMLKFIEQAKDVKHILVEKTDRLYRNLTDYSRIDQSEHIIHLVKENEILSKDSKSHAKFIHGIKALMAKNYSDNLSEEVKKGQTEKAEQGHFPTVAPYGYKNNLETRLIQVEQNESILIKRAFELYLTQEFSFATLRDKLFEEGFRYSPSQPRVPLTTIERMLQNPIYIGDFYWGGKYYKGKHEPLVSVEDFERVQSIIQNRFKGHITKRQFQFSGLLNCAECGHAITAEIKKEKYIYYHCSNRRCVCKNQNTREEEIETQFEEILKSIQISENYLDLIIEALKEDFGNEKSFHKEAVSNIQGQLQKIQIKLEKIYEDKLEGVIVEEFWFRKHHEYKQEQSRLLRSLEDHKKGSNNYLETGIQLIELAQKALILYKRQGNTEKRRLLRFISSNFLLQDQKLL